MMFLFKTLFDGPTEAPAAYRRARKPSFPILRVVIVGAVAAPLLLGTGSAIALPILAATVIYKVAWFCLYTWLWLRILTAVVNWAIDVSEVWSG